MGVRVSYNDGSVFFAENPKQDMMNKLIEKTYEARHLLTFEEASEDPQMIPPNSYAFYYGSYREAAWIAWQKAKARLFQQSVHEKGEKMSHYTFENIKRSIREYYQQNGRLPCQHDVQGDPGLPSWTTMLKHLGPKSGWNRLIADLVSKPELSQSSMSSSENVPAMTVMSKDEASSVNIDLPMEGESSVDGNLSSAEAVLSLEEPSDEPPSEVESLGESLSEVDALSQVDFMIGAEEPSNEDTMANGDASIPDSDTMTIEFKLLLPGRNPILITLTI